MERGTSGVVLSGAGLDLGAASIKKKGGNVATDAVSEWKYSGVTITADRYGKFRAVAEGVDRLYKEKVTVKKRLPVVGRLRVPYNARGDAKKRDGELFATNITGLNRSTGSFQFDPEVPANYGYQDIVADTPQARAALVEMARREADLDVAKVAVSERLIPSPRHGRIDADDYEKRVSPIEKTHAEIVDADAKAGVQDPPHLNKEEPMGQPDEQRDGQTEGSRDGQREEPEQNPDKERGDGEGEKVEEQ